VRYGAPGLLFSKFVPGLSTAAAPLAGMFRMKIWKFVLSDGLGAFIWASVYSGLGYIFHDQLEDLAQQAARMGSWLGGLIGLAVVSYIAWKYIARIAPEELRGMLDDGEAITVLDLRNALDWTGADAFKLPGAVHMSFEEIEQRMDEIPLDRDVILYCT
jgi:hypothetical protein